MDDVILGQLTELAKAFNKIGIKPVICGGLGVYLCFSKSEGTARSMIRATNDIDLMIIKEQVAEMSRREAIAEIIKGEQAYVVRKGGEHFRFTKAPNQQLDILSQPMDEFADKGNRVKFVKSKLHGLLTREALFIDEDLRTIGLKDKIEVQVPSPTNLLILKLCAFDDRDESGETERAQAHAYDIYITMTLANRDDYLEGQKFLARHNDWKMIQKVASIVKDKFGSVDKPGWQRVLEAAGFYPTLNAQQKRDELEKAKDRLLRWFTLSEHNHSDR
jgi:predicted nucleotidyltransferase